MAPNNRDTKNLKTAKADALTSQSRKRWAKKGRFLAKSQRIHQERPCGAVIFTRKIL